MAEPIPIGRACGLLLDQYQPVAACPYNAEHPPARLWATRIISIRPIYNADQAGVLRINANSHPAVAPFDRAELGRLLALGGFHLVAVDSDRTIVGYALAFAMDDPYDGEEFQYFAAQIALPFLYIDQIAVAGVEQRRGVGRKLYLALRAHAEERGIHVLCCEVNTSPPNPISLEFHTQLGFGKIQSRIVRDGRTVALLVSTV